MPTYQGISRRNDQLEMLPVGFEHPIFGLTAGRVIHCAIEAANFAAEMLATTFMFK